MGITERLAALSVQVSTSDGQVSAQIVGRDEVRVTFAPGYYRQASERELASRLEQVARLLWAARERGYRRILDDEYRECLVTDAPPAGQADQDFYAGRETLVASGRSPDGRILLAVKGMRDWRVSIAPGTIQALTESDFRSAVAAATGQLLDDQRTRLRGLRMQIFEPGMFDRFKETP